jgi:FSR family fosmidomycin resistance protein-like MFS transporter
MRRFTALLRQPRFLSVSLGHFGVDLLNSQLGVLLAYLSGPLALNNAAIGLIAILYSMAGSLTQPLFGWLADKYGARGSAAGGALWMMAGFALASLASGYWPIVWLILASFGSAAFHPAGTAVAATARAPHAAHENTATAASIFFLFGQVGLSLGPALGGAILERGGLRGLLGVTLGLLPLGAFLLWALHSPRALPTHTRASASAPAPDWRAFLLIIALSGVRVWAQSAISTFAPKFFHDLGFAPATYGGIVACFMAGTAVGGVIGGALGDRWGRRRVIVISLALSIAPFYFFPLLSGWMLYAVALAAGLTNGASHSLLVTMAQKALPGRAALASGLTLGFTFTAGSVGVYLSGLVADVVGLQWVLQGNALIALLAVLMSLWVREGRGAARVVAHAGIQM